MIVDVGDVLAHIDPRIISEPRSNPQCLTRLILVNRLGVML